MRLTKVALLGSLLAFAACDSGPEEEFGREIDDPRIDSAASSSERPYMAGEREPIEPDPLPVIPPRDGGVQDEDADVIVHTGISPAYDVIDVSVERVQQPEEQQAQEQQPQEQRQE